jgi:hypothetical protein
MKAKIAILLLALLCAPTLCQDMDLTLTSADITTVGLSSLFPAVATSNQVPAYTYTSSHPAAFISQFEENRVDKIFNGDLQLTGDNTIDAVAYSVAQTNAKFMVNGTFMTYKYDPKAELFSNPTTLVIKPDTKCTGLDFNSKFHFIGCLDLDNKQADIYTVENNAVAQSFILPFEEDKEITTRLRLEVSLDGNYLMVWDDMFTKDAGNPNQNALYILTVNETTGALSTNTTFTTIGTTVPKNLFDMSMSVGEDGRTLKISLINDATGFVEVNSCTVDDAQSPIVLTDCAELGIADLKITSGRAKYFVADNVSPIMIFNNNNPTNPTIHRCVFDETSGKFSDCAASNRRLPIQATSNVVCTSMTIFANNYSFEWLNTANKVVYSVVNVNPTAQDQTILRFDSIVEPSQLATLAFGANEAIVVFSTFAKVYLPVANSGGAVQITAQDFPLPDPTRTNVRNKRALVTITQTSQTAVVVTKTIRVTVLEKMNSWTGFNDQIPDFGGVAGGPVWDTNMNRSWVYGNNLSFQLSGSALNSPVVSTMDPVNISVPDVAGPFTAVFPINDLEYLVTDATKWYYIRCAFTFSPNKNCPAASSGTIPLGYTIDKVIPTTTYPNTADALAISVLLKNGADDYTIQYIWKADYTKNEAVSLPGGPYRSVHSVNYKGTLLFFGAPITGDDASNILAYSTSEEKAAFAEPTLAFTIKASDFGLLDSISAPFALKSCAHNDFVLEFLTSMYIIKINILTEATFSFRGKVRLANPQYPGNAIIDFSPVGDEMIVWDSSYNLWSTNTLNDASLYHFNVQEFGLTTISRVLPCNEPSSFVVYGTNAQGQQMVGTFYGNQFNVAHTKIHSIVPTNRQVADDFNRSAGCKGGIINMAITPAGTIVGEKIYLGGPYLTTSYKSNFTDPNATITITSGDQTRTIVKQMNIQPVDFTVTVKPVQNAYIKKGQFDLETLASITGPVINAELTLPTDLQGKITLSQRTLATSPVVKAGYSLKSVLLTKSNYVAYLSQDAASGALGVSLVTNAGVLIKDYPLGRTSIIGIDAADGGNYVAITVCYRWGGSNIVEIHFVPLTGEAQKFTAPDQSFFSGVKISKVPSTVVDTFAVFLELNLQNAFVVLKATKTDGFAGASWDYVPGSVQLIKVDNPEAGMVLFHNYRQMTLTLYILANDQATKGTQTVLTFDGSRNEFYAGACKGLTPGSIDCAFLVHGAVAYYANIPYNASFVVTATNILTRSLFIYYEAGQSGQPSSIDITSGYIAIQNINSTGGNVDIYQINSGQGFIYTRINLQKQSNSNSNNLTESLSFETFGQFFSLSSGNGLSVNTIQQNGSQTAAFTVQPLTLNVSEDLKQNDASAITINLGQSTAQTSFPIADFFSENIPTPPNPPPGPEPEKPSSKAWVYVLLIILIVGLIGAGVWFFLKKQKKGDEGDLYYDKNEPFVDDSNSKKDDGKGKGKSRNSDEFN